MVRLHTEILLMIRIKENGGGVAILPGKCRWTTEPKFKLSSKESFQVLFLSSPHGVFSPKNTKTSQHWMHMQDELMGHFYTDGIRLSSQHSFFIYIIDFLTWICNSYLHRSMPCTMCNNGSSSSYTAAKWYHLAVMNLFMHVCRYSGTWADGFSLCSLKISFVTSNNHISKPGNVSQFAMHAAQSKANFVRR